MEKTMKINAINILTPETGEDIFSYIQRTNKNLNERIYRQIAGAANPFKEGDETIGVAALNEISRMNARILFIPAPRGYGSRAWPVR